VRLISQICFERQEREQRERWFIQWQTKEKRPDSKPEETSNPHRGFTYILHGSAAQHARRQLKGLNHSTLHSYTSLYVLLTRSHLWDGEAEKDPPVSVECVQTNPCYFLWIISSLICFMIAFVTCFGGKVLPPVCSVAVSCEQIGAASEEKLDWFNLRLATDEWEHHTPPCALEGLHVDEGGDRKRDASNLLLAVLQHVLDLWQFFLLLGFDAFGLIPEPIGVLLLQPLNGLLLLSLQVLHLLVVLTLLTLENRGER